MLPGSPGVPTLAEPARAVPGDQCQVRQRLDILDQGRSAADAALGHRRPAEPGQRVPAGDPARESRLLTGEEPRGRVDEADRDAIEAAAGPLGDGVAQAAPQLRVAVHIQVRLPRADSLGRELKPVEYQMRGDRQQRLVLGAGRLALGAVGDDDGGSPAASTACSLQVGGERGAAAAGEAGRGCGRDQSRAVLRRAAAHAG